MSKKAINVKKPLHLYKAAFFIAKKKLTKENLGLLHTLWTINRSKSIR
jgi:hypothetical protein